MIQPLRSVHRRVWMLLAVGLPTAILIALSERPAQSEGGPVRAFVEENRGMPVRWSRHDVHARIIPTDDSQHLVIAFNGSSIDDPDLLLYWSRAEVHGDLLPMDAVLVGRVVRGRQSLVNRPPTSSGYLVLYSMPHQTVVDAAHVETLP